MQHNVIKNLYLVKFVQLFCFDLLFKDSKVSWIFLKASLSYDGRLPRPGAAHPGGSFTNLKLTDLVQKLYCACIMKIWNVECALIVKILLI